MQYRNISPKKSISSNKKGCFDYFAQFSRKYLLLEGAIIQTGLFTNVRVSSTSFIELQQTFLNNICNNLQSLASGEMTTLKNKTICFSRQSIALQVIVIYF